MNSPQHINIDEFNYELPDERIAKYPLSQRDNSKLLIYRNDKIEESVFNNITNILPANSLLVSNNTKVIRARMEFFKSTGARIEIFCLEPKLPADYNLAFNESVSCQWHCIIGNLKKWKEGILEKTVEIDGKTVNLKAERISSYGESHIVEFKWDNDDVTFGNILENSGNIPIPPYLNRKAESSDTSTYQTVYSKHEGSVAAPTAGLHFTDAVFNELKNNGITCHEVTLHVGAGTFKPVKSETIGEHDMHTEHFVMNKNTIPPLLQHLGNTTAVGTTTVRTLESIYWIGVKLLSDKTVSVENIRLGQWEAYELPQDIKPVDALNEVHRQILELDKTYINAATAIMIAPTYKFRVINRLVTNFHQPKSTLLLLISALIGDNWKKVYKYASNNDFRFLSYGDSCVLEPTEH